MRAINYKSDFDFIPKLKDRDTAEKERARVFATYAATISDMQTRLTTLESKRGILLED